MLCRCCTVAPIVKVNKKTVYQAVGYRIELQCFGEGNPIPEEKLSYWTRDGVPLPSSSDEYVGNVIVLLDTGTTYTCFTIIFHIYVPKLMVLCQR